MSPGILLLGKYGVVYLTRSIAAESSNALLAIATAGPRQERSAIPAATPNEVTRVSATRPITREGPRTASADNAFDATSAELTGPHASSNRHSTNSQPLIPRG